MRSTVDDSNKFCTCGLLDFLYNGSNASHHCVNDARARLSLDIAGEFKHGLRPRNCGMMIFFGSVADLEKRT